MLRLKPNAQKILQTFGEVKPLPDDVHEWKRISNSYIILLTYFLFNIQENLEYLPKEVRCEIYVGISRIYESIFWAKKSLGSEVTESVECIDLIYGKFTRVNKISGIYQSAAIRLLKSCKHNLFLENSLLRLNNSYEIFSDILDRSATIDTAKNIVRRSIALKDNS